MQSIFKRIGIAVMALSMFTLSSCDELKDLLKFDFDLVGEAIYIDVDPIEETGKMTEMGSETYDKSLAQILEEEAPGADIGKIKEINLTGITFEIVEGTDADNNFHNNVSSIRASVSADGISAKVVGESSARAESQTRWVIPVTDGKVNVKDYFSKTNFNYSVEGTFLKPTTKTLRLKVTANYSFVFGL